MMKKLSTLAVVPCLALLLLANGRGQSSPSMMAPFPSNKPDSYPDWWFRRGVIKKLDLPDVGPDWPTTYPKANDFAALNGGQLKAFAFAAFDELEARLAARGGAGSGVTNLIKSWCELDGGVIRRGPNGDPVPKAGAGANDFAAVNLGQLKHVADLFWFRLIDLEIVTTRPWSGTGAEDFALANIGQAKQAFAFVLTIDTDKDGIPDDWELAHGLNPTDPLDAYFDTDSDGWVALSEYELGTDPRDPYNGARPPGPPAAPSNVIYTRNADGSVDFRWKDNSNNETEFIIYMPGPGGAQIEVARVSHDQTTFHLPASQVP